MVKTLSLKIPKKGKVFVKKGEKVKAGAILAEGKGEGERKTFSLAQIFKISPSQIFQVLVKKLGEGVKKGEILAQKGKILGRVVFKSPIDGRLAEVSPQLGEIVVVEKGEKLVLKSPVSGLVQEVGEEEIKLEFEGEVFLGKKGEGKTVSGQIENLPPNIGVLDLPAEIAKKILVGEKFSAAVLAKAWTLEAAGLVGAGFDRRPPLPFLVAEKKIIKNLRGYQGKKAVLDPKNKQLVVLF